MEVKISRWQDLQVGDVWLGTEIEEIRDTSITLRRADGGYMRGAVAIDCNPWTIDTLIAAGNDTVERKPKKVEAYLLSSLITGLLSVCDSGEQTISVNLKCDRQWARSVEDALRAPGCKRITIELLD